MIKDVTSFPDQNMIYNNIVRVPFQSKLDLTKAYDQVHIYIREGYI
jgi:hypothetical protein